MALVWLIAIGIGYPLFLAADELGLGNSLFGVIVLWAIYCYLLAIVLFVSIVLIVSAIARWIRKAIHEDRLRD
jgi:hypothetical protein